MAESDPMGALSQGPAALPAVEAAVQAALASGRDDSLQILGHGEITLVVGWPPDRPVMACKRLPLFSSPDAAHRYADVFSRYLARLEQGGLRLVPSSFEVLPPEADGRCAGYVVQPVLPADSLGPAVLRSATPDPDHPLLTAVIDSLVRVVDDRTGVDGQISNWSFAAGAVSYFDVTTPILSDDDGFALVIDVQMAAYPWLLRAPLRRFVAPSVAAAYCDVRTVLLDLAANLHKERLTEWMPAMVEAVNRVTSPPISDDEARRYYRSDARLWEVMLRLRQADRWWQRSVRRRGYPFLLPSRTAR